MKQEDGSKSLFDRAFLEATCHCGSVVLRVKLLHGINDVCRCDCSFCSKRGAAAVTVHHKELEILRGSENLTLYEWGTRTAKHYFCITCGVYTHHRRRLDTNEYGVNVATLASVNVRNLGDIEWVDGVNHPSDAIA